MTVIRLRAETVVGFQELNSSYSDGLSCPLNVQVSCYSLRVYSVGELVVMKRGVFGVSTKGF